MKGFRWNAEKNEQLKAGRGVSFEDVALAIGSGGLLDVVEHPNAREYPNQGVFVVAMGGYVYLVPHVEESDSIFLKTVFPSRKATRDYGLKEKNEKSRSV